MCCCFVCHIIRFVLCLLGRWRRSLLPSQIILWYFCVMMFLLSLRPPQNEVHPRHGRAHSGGHAGSWARAEESYHPHLLWYDAVWAQLQPWTHVWNGKKNPAISQVQHFLFFFYLIWLKLLPAKYDTWDVYDGVFFYFKFPSYLCSLRTNW